MTSALMVLEQGGGQQRRRVVKVRRELEVPMTDAEVAEASAKHVGCLNEIDAEKAELARVSKDAKEVLADLRLQEKRLRQMVQGRVRDAMVECEEVYEYASGVVVERRMDTGAVISTRPMSEAEGQLVAPAVEGKGAVEVRYASGVTAKAMEVPVEAVPVDPGAPVPVPVKVLVVVDGALLAKAVEVLKETRRASTAALQRRLKLTFVAACDVMEALEREGLVSAPDKTGAREVEWARVDGWQAPAAEG